MRSTSTRVIVVLVAIAAAMAMYVVLQDDGEGESVVSEPLTAPEETGAPVKPPAPPSIVIKGGQPVGGVAELKYRRGDRIRFVVRSDVDEEIHLHGYDVSKEIAAGGVARFDLEADIEGLFEVELENSAVPIAEIEVAPK